MKIEMHHHLSGMILLRQRKYGAFGIQQEILREPMYLAKRQAGKRITKLILLDSQSPSYLKLHATLFKQTQKRNLISDINYAVGRLRAAGVKEVRHFDGPLPTMVIFNPNDKRAWSRLEVWGPFLEAGSRPIVIIRKNKNPEAFDALLGSFNKIWESCNEKEQQRTN